MFVESVVHKQTREKYKNSKTEQQTGEPWAGVSVRAAILNLNFKMWYVKQNCAPNRFKHSIFSSS